MTGASGVIYGVKILKVLSQLGIETHLIITQAGLKTLEIETSDDINGLKPMAFHVYAEGDLSAPLASGSFKVDGMVIAPCSSKTLSEIANS
jgi:4-hydroxy-3-polyprenylbenzoate decarboxylase